MMPRTGEGGDRRIAGCQCSLGGMFVQWCHGKEAGAPGPGEHRLDVEGDMRTMRSYHQTRMRVPAICEGAGAKDDFIAKYGAETKIIVLLAKKDDGTSQLSNLTQGIRRYDDTAFKEVSDAVA